MVDYFKSLFRFRLVDCSLRPLLYAAGAAASAAGIYYAYNAHQKSTREAGYTTIYQEKSAPMTGSSPDPNLKFLEDSLAEAQRRNEQAMEKITQLDVTNNFLLSKLVAVQQELSERGVKCKELLRVSLAEAERKYSEAMESRAQLENEKTELMSQVNTLRGSVQHLEEELSEIRTRCDILKLLLSQAEMNYDQAMLSNARLESEKSDLMSMLEELEGDEQQALRDVQQVCRGNK